MAAGAPHDAPSHDPFPAGAAPAAGTPHARYVSDRLTEIGRWGAETLAVTVERHARERPDRLAFIAGDDRVSWREYHDRALRIADALIRAGLQPGERVGVMMADGATVHAAIIGAEMAGLATVGVGPRAAYQELRHLLTVAGATALITTAEHRGRDMAEEFARLRADGVPLRHHVVVDLQMATFPLVDGQDVGRPDTARVQEAVAARRLQLGDIWLINSTSGTTGMPKCVVHHQNRWRYYHELALDAGAFTDDDVFMGLIPAPFGFGVWTAHTTPTFLGAPTVVMAKFKPDEALRLIAAERVTVLSCVSTAFIMMLNSPVLDEVDLSSLRCLFTGGEAVPYARAAEFEDRTGAQVLQFYGSNETGTLSYTKHSDDRAHRLQTAGRVIPAMNVRLFAEDGRDVTATGGPGQAACAGPATCLGYYSDHEANARLFTPDGWMLTGDLCTIDAEGYLTVVGRTSDFIIRGGKNVSAAAVEEQVSSHPAVAMAAAVAMPDPVYGERVCVYVEVHGGVTLTLDDVTAHLAAREVSKDAWPERLVVVDEIPRSSGGKIAKGELRQDIATRLQSEVR